MILIFSIEQDESTIDVLKWLDFYGAKYILLNNNEVIENISINVNDSTFKIKTTNEEFSYKDITSVWYRRGNFINNINIVDKNEVAEAIKLFIKEEYKDLFEYLHFLLHKKYSINNYNFSNVNKLKVLDFAKKVGLNIPLTYLCNNLPKMDTRNNVDYISKPITNPINFYKKNFWLPTYTELIERKDKNIVNQKYSCSLFQENIKKLYEIRSFYIKGEFYSMAIFSQNDNNTKVDYRKYNYIRPNRNVPYILPDEVQNKLKLISQEYQLESCSFDLIYDINGKFYFLEVNPIGQFGMVSFPCNYYLEREIAKKLIKRC